MMNLAVVGQSTVSAEFGWTDREVMLYALGVGASLDDGLSELQFTTENTAGVALQVLPTFASLVAQQAAVRPSLGEYPPGVAVHAGESLYQHRPLPAAATVVARTTVTGIYDKGSGALATIDTEVIDAATDDVLTTAQSSVFVRGEGNFGGDRGPSGSPSIPERAPDHSVSYPTRSDQALLYRLMGDRNPLHSDPQLARARGTERPILHGMCTWGFTGRALLHTLYGGDSTRMTTMSGRFTNPVIPGDLLTVDIWVDGEVALYRTSTSPGNAVLTGSCPAGSR